MGEDSVSCHGVTALVYSPASILDPEGLAVTCWHHFIHLVENERRVACSFMILLARFLSLLVCLTPTAWKIENMFLCSPSFSVSVYVCYSYKHLHTKIFVYTLKYLCVGVCDPWVLALCWKKLLYLSSMSLAATKHTSLWYRSLLDWVVRYVQSESPDQRRRVENQSQTIALWWVTCKEEMTVRDTNHL